MATNDNILSVGDLAASVTAPGPGTAMIIVQINPSDRASRALPADNPKYGMIDANAAVRAINNSEQYFDKIISQIPTSDRKNLRVMFFASPSELKEPGKPFGVGHHMRAKKGAELTQIGLKAALRKNKLSANKTIIDDGHIYTPTAFNELNALTKSPEYEKFLMDAAKKVAPDAWQKSFWQMLERDDFSDARKSMHAEGPADIANRVHHMLSLIVHGEEYRFRENPNTRLIIHVTLMYDNLGPYLQQIFGTPWMGMDKNSGIVIQYDYASDRFISDIKHHQYAANAWDTSRHR